VDVTLDYNDDDDDDDGDDDCVETSAGEIRAMIVFFFRKLPFSPAYTFPVCL